MLMLKNVLQLHVLCLVGRSSGPIYGRKTDQRIKCKAVPPPDILYMNEAFELIDITVVIWYILLYIVVAIVVDVVVIASLRVLKHKVLLSAMVRECRLSRAVRQTERQTGSCNTRTRNTIDRKSSFSHISAETRRQFIRV